MGSGVLSHASRSQHVDPGRPSAADGSLRPQYPAAVAGWSKRIDPLLRHEVEGVHRLGSLGYQVGPSEPQLTTSWTAMERIRFGIRFRTEHDLTLDTEKSHVTSAHSSLTHRLTVNQFSCVLGG